MCRDKIITNMLSDILGILTSLCIVPGILGEATAECFKKCPDGWINFQNSCYLFSDNLSTDWTEATHHCALYHASLVKIDSKHEDLFLKDLMKRLFRPPNNAGVGFWTGATDEITEGLWVWYTTSEYLSYTNWGQGQPDSSGGADEDCLCMLGSYNFTWHDVVCSTNSFHSICEISLDEPGNTVIVG